MSSKSEFFAKNPCKPPLFSPAPSLWALGLLAGMFLLPLALWGGAGPTPAPLPEEASPAPAALPDTLRVLLPGGQVVIMTLEDYVTGVVSAEMPATFPTEALKAQAVAARTYALRRSGVHPGADVCGDYTCCQAWRPPAQLEPASRSKVRAAVAATAGEVLTYRGQPIDAVFHSSSAGYTADAAQVWGAAVPYLVSVPTPETEAAVPNFHTEVTFAPDSFAELFRAAHPEADLSGPPESWFGEPETAPWGGVTRVTVGGVAVTGVELRALCALRSARFTVAANDEAVTFSVTAYGHGVGMSQYGAALLAEEGLGYRDILAHYYPGAELEAP